MIRALTLIGVLCFVASIAIFAISASPVGVIPLLVAVAISFVLGVRRAFLKVRDVVADARRFASGNVQKARIVDVGDPKGIFNTRVAMAIELEGEDGTVHSFDRDVPIPAPLAWSYRFGRRFNVPGVRSINLAESMALELRREGMDVSVARGANPSGLPA